MTQRTMDDAIKRTPGSVTKQGRGQPSKRRKGFSVYTVSRLMEEFRDPRAILLEIASQDTHALAAEMQSSLMDALAERRLAAMAVLPYVASKMPVSVDMRTSRTIHLNLVTESQYEELVAVAATEDADSDSFSMQLISSAPVEHTTTEAQTAEQGDEKPVSPPVAADVPDRLRAEHEWWDQLGSARRQVIDATPSRDAADSWSRDGNGNGVWPPERKK